MKRRTVLQTMVLSLSIAAVIGCSKKDDIVLIQVDDWQMTGDKYQRLAIGRFGGEEMVNSQSQEALETHLQEMLVRQLKVVDGHHKGYDNNPEVILAGEEAENRAAITELYFGEVVSKIVAENDIREFYDKDKEEIDVSHILIRVNAGNDSMDAAVLDTIKTIRARLLNGERFAELAKVYNQDSSTPDGSIGWFKHGVMEKSFEDAAYALKRGDVSEPVRTSYGYHLIQMNDRRKIKDRPSYKASHDMIRQMLMNQNGLELRDLATEYVEGLMAEREIQWHDNNLSKLFRVIDKKSNPRDPISLLSEEDQALPLVTLDNGEINISSADIHQYLSRFTVRGYPIESVEKIQEIIKNYITEKIVLIDAARAGDYYGNEKVIQQKRDAEDAKVYQFVQSDVISQRIAPTEQEIEDFYKENASKYMIEAQYTLIEAFVESKDLADEIYTRAKKGENLRDLAAKYSIRKDAKKNKGVFGPIRRGMHGAIGRMASETKMGDIVGPVTVGKNYSVFKVISKEEPRVQELDKVRIRVMNDLKQVLRKKVEDAYTDSLKTAISYKFYPKRLAKVFPDAGK